VCGVDGRVSAPVEGASVIRSLLAPDAVLAAVQSGYAVGSLDECTLMRALINDVYLLAGPGEQYVFKVYRPEWRDIPALLWEVDLLARLSREGATGAPSIARRDGRMITTFAAPEGTRHGVLFAYAEGRKPLPPFDAELFHRFGHARAWPCRSSRTHGAGEPALPMVPSSPRDAARFDTVLPHPDCTAQCQLLLPSDRPTRSTPFLLGR